MTLIDRNGDEYNVTHPHLDVWEARPVSGELLCVRRKTLKALKRSLALTDWKA